MVAKMVSDERGDEETGVVLALLPPQRQGNTRSTAGLLKKLGMQGIPEGVPIGR